MSIFNSASNRDKVRFFWPMVLVSLTVISLVAAVYYESNLKRQVYAESKIRLLQASNLGANVLSQFILQYRKTLYFLHATPPIEGLVRASANGGIDPFDNTNYDQWRHRLETIFTALMQNHEEIDQLRVISLQGDGKELVRTDRLTGKIISRSNDQLQSKKGRSYYTNAEQLNPRELYISSITLNKEYRKIEFPYRPTIRFVTDIFDQQGNRFGLIVVNVNAEGLLLKLKNSVEEPLEVILTDDEGHLVLHPDPHSQFTKDLDPSKTWNSLYQHLPANNAGLDFVEEKATGRVMAYQEIPIHMGVENGIKYLNFIVALPEREIFNLMVDSRVHAYGFVFVVLAVLSVFLLIYQSSMTNQLALSEARAEYAAIINCSSDAVVGMNNEGRITIWNPSASRLFGFVEDEVKGHFIDDLGLFVEARLAPGIKEVVGKGLSKSMETKVKDLSGRMLDVSLSISPIRYGNRTVNGVAALIQDITIIKESEASIKRTNEELERQIAERTTELREAHAKAVKASEVKSAFISNISHEMRTPLNGMIGTLNLIRREPLTPTQQRYLKMTENSTTTLATLINDILDLSKVEAGKLEMEFIEFDPNRLLEIVILSTAVKAQEKGLEIILDQSELCSCRIKTDPLRLQQIITNLLNNAIKFTESGEVVVRASLKEGEDGQHHLHVAIQDTGVGIADENQDKLFQAFSQEHAGIAGKYGGTGLGLSICKQLIMLLGGEIGFESQEGQGSTFHFSIDLKEPPTARVDEGCNALKGKMVGCLVKVNTLKNVLFRQIEACGATAFSLSKLELNDDLWLDSMPDMILLDVDHPEFERLIRWLECRLSAGGKLPSCFVMANPVSKATIDIPLTHQVVEKPLTRSDFLMKVSGVKQSEEFVAPVDIPLPAHVEQPKEEQDSGKLKGYSVLVVDDNQINQAVAMGILQPLECDILTANNGKEAIEVLAQAQSEGRHISCVLMDCQMPEMDGYEATRRIRHGDAGKPCRDVPIMAMTANAMSGERERCLGAGMNEYMTKPLIPAELQKQVICWCHSRQSQT